MQGLIECGPGSQYPRVGSVQDAAGPRDDGRSIILPSSLPARA